MYLAAPVIVIYVHTNKEPEYEFRRLSLDLIYPSLSTSFVMPKYSPCDSGFIK